MTQTSLDKNAPQAWENYFQGGWEQNHGRRQTALFASYFVETVPLPSSVHTMLDVACAMGDAMPIFRDAYPHLVLHGCDISTTAIAKARTSYGDIATFYDWCFDDIEGTFDAIHCCGTLEHFVDYLRIARRLLRHCSRLYVLVPYREMRNGLPLTPEEGQFHVVTLDEHSFDSLLEDSTVKRIRHWVHPCPVAWGPARAPRDGVAADGSEMIFFELTINPERDEEAQPSRQSAARVRTAEQRRTGWLDPIRRVDPELAEWLGGAEEVGRDIQAAIAFDDRLILVDDDHVRVHLDRPLRVVPFSEHGDEYWGAPQSDDVAIAILERLRSEGAAYLAVAWTSFWWFDQYPALAALLRERFRCVLRNERVVVYDLRDGDETREASG